MLALAELQSDPIGEGWRSIHAHSLAQGLPQNGGARFAYTRQQSRSDGDRYEQDAQTVPWLRLAYERFAAGISANEVDRQLNEASVPTRRDGRWTPTTLLRVLDSGFGAGLLVVSPDSAADSTHLVAPGQDRFLPGAYEPAITADLWSAYRLRREKTRPLARATQEAHRLLRCGTCGRNLVRFKPSSTAGAGGTDRSEGFECNRSLRTGNPCPAPVSIRRHLGESAVERWLRARTNAREGDLLLANAKNARVELLHTISTLVADVDQLRASRSELLDDILDDFGDPKDRKPRFDAE